MKKYVDATKWGKMITEAELNAEETTRSLGEILADLSQLTKELREKLEEVSNND